MKKTKNQVRMTTMASVHPRIWIARLLLRAVATAKVAVVRAVLGKTKENLRVC
jgi:hypothetical protein